MKIQRLGDGEKIMDEKLHEQCAERIKCVVEAEKEIIWWELLGLRIMIARQERKLLVAAEALGLELV